MTIVIKDLFNLLIDVVERACTFCIDRLLNKLDLLTWALDELTNSGISVNVICITEYNMKPEDVNIVNIAHCNLASNVLTLN